MPRFPEFAVRTEHITGSVFEKFREKMMAQGSHMVSLHIGDCYALPPYDLPIDPEFVRAHPQFNRYCDTFGVLALREVLVEKLRAENDLQVDSSHIMMTAGACSALNVSMQALVGPGDDVVVLSPYWPLFRGMVRLAGGKVIEAPFYTRLYDDSDMDVETYLNNIVTPNTTALYLNSPNNPSGKVLDRRQLEQVARVVRRNNLWLVTDEAYDGMTYDDHTHISIASLPDMFERTLSVFTFSKVYMFSGLRLGYVVAPAGVLKILNKVMVHQYYSPATVSQHMMVEAVATRAQWSGRFVKHAHNLRDRFIDNLDISPRVPEGTYYLFFSIKEYLRGRDYWDVIDACLDEGVSVAPGQDFGQDFADHIRICFAGEPPERLDRAIERLNAIFPA